MKASSGLMRYIYDIVSLQEKITGGELRFYTGEPPRNPNHGIPASAMLCGVIENTNLLVGPNDQSLVKDPNQEWTLKNSKGDPTWLRLSGHNAIDGHSELAVRIDATITTAFGNGDLRCSSLPTRGSDLTMDAFEVQLDGAEVVHPYDYQYEGPEDEEEFVSERIKEEEPEPEKKPFDWSDTWSVY